MNKRQRKRIAATTRRVRRGNVRRTIEARGPTAHGEDPGSNCRRIEIARTPTPEFSAVVRGGGD